MRLRVSTIVLELNRTPSSGTRVRLSTIFSLLGCGHNLRSKTVAALWRWAHARHPLLVGGCRPLELRHYLAPELWSIEHVCELSAYGIPSTVLVASKKVY
jgi:hypothetical protein